MSDDSPNLGLPFLAAGQAQKHVTLNAALSVLDALVQLAVTSAVLTAPPGSPAEGDRYIVAASPTGAWAGQAKSVAVFQAGAWAFHAPDEGWLAWDRATGALLVYDAGDWTDLTPAITALQNLTLLGVGTTADSSNPLSLVGAGALLAAKTAGAGGTGDFTFTLNKETAADTLQLLLQRGFSTRALLGLLGDDDLTVKVSPNGSSFFTAVSIDKDTGNIAFGGATADGTNALIVKGLAMLFDAAVDDLRFTFNKAAAGDDCALTFQSGYSARALVGLLGNDDFTFKVSPDGSNYFNGLVLDKDNGAASLPANPKFSAWVNFDKYIGAGAWTAIGMNNTRHNDQAAFASGTGLFTAPHAGYYTFGAGFTFKQNGTVPTAVQIGLSVNGATPTADRRGIAGDAAIVTLESSVSVTALIKLGAGDTVSPHAFMATNDGYVLADENYFWGHEVA